MDTQTVLKYVMNSPENTNPNVLKGMLDQLSGGGGGESGFSTARVTVNNQALAFYMPIVDPNTISIAKPTSGTFDVPLYKGRLDMFLEKGVTANIESGNATLEGNYLVITGDCTITIS